MIKWFRAREHDLVLTLDQQLLVVLCSLQESRAERDGATTKLEETCCAVHSDDEAPSMSGPIEPEVIVRESPQNAEQKAVFQSVQ